MLSLRESGEVGRVEEDVEIQEECHRSGCAINRYAADTIEGLFSLSQPRRERDLEWSDRVSKEHLGFLNKIWALYISMVRMLSWGLIDRKTLRPRRPQKDHRRSGRSPRTSKKLPLQYRHSALMGIDQRNIFIQS